MSNQGKMDCGRRRLIVATAAVGGAGAVVALVPFVSSLLPSERAKAAGAPVEVDIGKLEAHGLVRRTPEDTVFVPFESLEIHLDLLTIRN